MRDDIKVMSQPMAALTRDLQLPSEDRPDGDEDSPQVLAGIFNECTRYGVFGGHEVMQLRYLVGRTIEILDVAFRMRSGFNPGSIYAVIGYQVDGNIDRLTTVCDDVKVIAQLIQAEKHGLLPVRVVVNSVVSRSTPAREILSLESVE